MFNTASKRLVIVFSGKGLGENGFHAVRFIISMVCFDVSKISKRIVEYKLNVGFGTAVVGRADDLGLNTFFGSRIVEYRFGRSS